MSWIPVDITANIIVDLVLANAGPIHKDDAPTSSSSAVPSNMHHYNLVNPHPGVWSTLVPTVIQYFQNEVKSSTIEPVPFSAWLSALLASAALGTEDVAKNPGIKLLDFYTAMNEGGAEEEAMLETKETAKTSESMRALAPVGKEWMGIWLGQWKF